MKSKLSIIIYILLTLVLVGCKSNKEATNLKQKDKAPDSLGDLSKSFDDILETIDKIEKVNLGLSVDEKEQKDENINKDQKQDKGSESPSGDQASNSQSKDTGKGSVSEGSDKSKSEMQKDEKLKLAWKEIDDKLEKAHNWWNKYDVEGIKKGVTQDKREQFQTSFNRMTKSIEARSIVDIYDFGSQSILNLRPFYDLYLDEVGGDISVLKYIGYQSYLRAISDDIVGASELLQSRDEYINKIRLKIGDKEEKVKELEMVNNSLGDMKKSLEENSKRLLMIKKNIIIKNLKQLE